MLDKIFCKGKSYGYTAISIFLHWRTAQWQYTYCLVVHIYVCMLNISDCLHWGTYTVNFVSRGLVIAWCCVHTYTITDVYITARKPVVHFYSMRLA